MNIRESDKIYGVPEGVFYGQFERTSEIDNRIKDRQFPDMPLKPNFNIRPTSTKYSIFPIVDRRVSSTVPMNTYLDYSTSYNFNPGTDRAPPSGYMDNIEIENKLRNQYFALQHGGDRGTHIPDTSSDLYCSTITVPKDVPIPSPLLFQKLAIDKTIHPNIANKNIGRDYFFNHTRTQLRNI
jgi:hypothetical protein